MPLTLSAPQLSRAAPAFRAKRSRTAGRPVCQAQGTKERQSLAEKNASKNPLGLGDVLGPIGITVGGDVKEEAKKASAYAAKSMAKDVVEKNVLGLGDLLGPIGITVGKNSDGPALHKVEEGLEEASTASEESIAQLSTEEWRQQYEQDGRVNLWVEEEFNSGSRLVGGRGVFLGRPAGFMVGEGIGASDAPRHKIKIMNHFAEQEIEVEVPEDRYILWEAEDQGLELPYACRMGCCTACAVKVKEGEVYQPHSLGVSRQLREQGYALMCVAFPSTDCVLETVPEDEVYMLQFGSHFEKYATDLESGLIERDDIALELALLDE